VGAKEASDEVGIRPVQEGNFKWQTYTKLFYINRIWWLTEGAAASFKNSMFVGLWSGFGFNFGTDDPE